MNASEMLKRLAEMSKDIGELMTEIEQDSGLTQPQDLDMEEIKQRVADYYKLPVASLSAPGRWRSVVEARRMAMFLCRDTGKTLMSVAAAFGNRDHGTVIHACKRVSNLISIRDPETLAALEKLKSTK